jgi:glycosyltransferase involved in cell wall biosynthesis
MTDNHLISIIIPCYNAEKFIVETISSVLNQTYPNLEIIIIDDGSTDSSKSKIETLKNNRVQYIHQNNQGVSSARNNGLKIAKGSYILFLDADDLLSNDFILNRFNFLELNNEFGACTSSIEIINENSQNQNKYYKNAFKIEDLTSFNPNSHTCPSGYLFRSSTLIKYQLTFNTQLSSSADKLFLYDFFKHAIIGFIEDSPLFYRVFKSSMSNSLSIKLVNDHIAYLNLIIQKKVIPIKQKKQIVSRINYTIGASFFHLKKRKKALLHLLKSFTSSPKVFLSLITNK